MNMSATATMPQGSYLNFAYGPYAAFREDLSSISAFFAQPGQASYAAANLQARADYAEVQPCSGSTQFYSAPGYTISAAGGAALQPAGPPPPPAGNPQGPLSPSPPATASSPSPGNQNTLRLGLGIGLGLGLGLLLLSAVVYYFHADARVAASAADAKRGVVMNPTAEPGHAGDVKQLEMRLATST